MKTSGSSDDNKKEFFETAPHVLKNSGLLLRSCFLNTVYSFLEILVETETSFVPVSLKKAVVSVENGISYFLKDAIAFCRFSKNSFLFLDATHFYLNLRRCY
ncbi:hypothetical protein FQT06_07840 [Enterococcus hirae]|nr:hypothetical protein [Enterococcus hirae]PCE08426.1 hypothetical protein CKY13_03070 [Enterococcus hirae]ROZ12522.1 hypothetical protein EGX06_09865 [Enterococcus hirae]